MRFANSALSLDQVRAAAPSAFATRPYEKMSPKYTFLPTEAAINAMIANGFEPYEASESRTRIEGKKGFTKHLIRFRQTNVELALGEAFPELLLLNGHDGSTQWKMMAGFFKLACTNGLIVAESMIEAISIRHSGNVAEDVVRGTLSLTEKLPAAIDAIGRWKQLELSNPEQKLFAEAVRNYRWQDVDGKPNETVKVEQLLEPRRAIDANPDLWSVYNRVQENATQGGLTAVATNGRRSTTRRIKSIDADVKLNRAMWHLAEGFEKLKTAAA